MTKQSVVHITGPHCGTHAEGEQLYLAINILLKNHEHVELDFNHIEVASSSFFNELFRRIIYQYGEDFLARHISYTALTPRHTFVLHRTQRLWLPQPSDT